MNEYPLLFEIVFFHFRFNLQSSIMQVQSQLEATVFFWWKLQKIKNKNKKEKKLTLPEKYQYQKKKKKKNYSVIF